MDRKLTMNTDVARMKSGKSKALLVIHGRHPYYPRKGRASNVPLGLAVNGFALTWGHAEALYYAALPWDVLYREILEYQYSDLILLGLVRFPRGVPKLTPKGARLLKKLEAISAVPT